MALSDYERKHIQELRALKDAQQVEREILRRDVQNCSHNLEEKE